MVRIDRLTFVQRIRKSRSLHVYFLFHLANIRKDKKNNIKMDKDLSQTVTKGLQNATVRS